MTDQEKREHARRKFRECRIEVVPPDPAKERAEGEPEDGRIPVAISSEAPVERYDWWDGETYLEVLDHGPGGVDLSYAKDGLPFCLDHDTRKQIGILEDVTLDADRRIRGMLRSGSHPDSEWTMQDIRNGIRKKVSVGYDPGETFEQTEEHGKKVRRYKGWLPMEASSVAVPADYSVGIGRNAPPGAPPTVTPPPAAATPAHKERTMTDEEKAAAAAAAAQAAKTTAEDERQRGMKQLAKIAKSFPEESRELYHSWLERGVSADQALDEVLEKRKAVAPAATPAGHLDLSERDRKQYNLAGAILAQAAALEGNRGAMSDASIGLVLEANAAIRERLSKAPMAREVGGGLLIPMDIRIDTRSAARGALFSRASVTGNIVGTSSLGGAGVQTSIVGFVDLLRARTRVAGLGAQMLTGLTDTIAFVRQLTANTFSFPGENPSTEMSLTAATIEVFTMSPKIGGAGSAYSRRMLAQGNANFDINSFVLNDLNKIAAIGIDSAAINGGGGTAPTGLRGTTGVQNKTLGANGAAIDWAALVDVERLVEQANAEEGFIGWLTNPSVKAKLKQSTKNTAAQSYLWESGPNFNGQVLNTLNGYQAVTSTSMPNNLTKGTNTTVCSAAIYGVWENLLIGEWGGAAELIVNPFTYAKQNVVEVTMTLGVDVGVLQPTAFVKFEDILTT